MSDRNVIALDRPSAVPDPLEDAALLQSIQWKPSAPQSLVTAAQQGDVPQFADGLVKRNFRTSKKSGGKKQAAPLGAEITALWSLPAFAEAADLKFVRAAEELCRGKQHRKAHKAGTGKTRSKRKQKRSAEADRLVDWCRRQEESALPPFECLVLYEVLSRFGHRLPDSAVWPLWRTAFVSAMAGNRDATDDPAESAERSLVVQGEMPWLAGLLFAGVTGAGSLRRSGQEFLERQLLDATDTDGTPSAELMNRLPLWLAPLIRARQWARLFSAELWDGESEQRLADLLERVAPLCRPDGRLPLAGDEESFLPLITTATQLVQIKAPPRNYLRALGNGSSRPKRGNQKKRKSSRRPANQSDWARFACLRNDWSVDADTLIVAHHQSQPAIELRALGRVLVSGPWEIDVRIDGKQLSLGDDWDCVCWHSDRDADYLELQMTFGKGQQVERQLLLSRTDHFAVLADCVTASSSSRIDYASRLPLSDDVTVESDVPTRECVLRRPGVSARTFPLGLPEDRVQSAPGQIGPVTGGSGAEFLELQQSSQGGVYAPLVLDWSKERTRQPADWRRLTVTEDGRILQAAAVAAHRLRIGSHQLFVYRSHQRPQVARAVLGHNTTNETVIGRFDQQGDVEPILLVE